MFIWGLGDAIADVYYIFYAFDVIKLTPLEWGILISISSITAVIFSLIGGKLSDKYGRKKVFLISFFFRTAAPIIFILSQNFYHVLLAFIFARFLSISSSSFPAFISDKLPKSKVGKV